LRRKSWSDLPWWIEYWTHHITSPRRHLRSVKLVLTFHTHTHQRSDFSSCCVNWHWIPAPKTATIMALAHVLLLLLPFSLLLHHPSLVKNIIQAHKHHSFPSQKMLSFKKYRDVLLKCMEEVWITRKQRAQYLSYIYIYIYIYIEVERANGLITKPDHRSHYVGKWKQSEL